MKRRQPINAQNGKKFKLNNNQKQRGFRPFGTPAMMDFHGPFPAIHPRHRFPPAIPPMPPLFRGRMGPPPMPNMRFPLMAPPRRPMRPQSPMMRPPMPMFMNPMPPRAMWRPPFPGPREQFPPPGPRVYNREPPKSFHNNSTLPRKRSKKRALKPNPTGDGSGDASPQEACLNDMNQPWISDLIRAENAKKQTLNRAARNSHSQEDWAVFKVQRDKCHSMVREARTKYLADNPSPVKVSDFKINPGTNSGKRTDFTEDTVL